MDTATSSVLALYNCVWAEVWAQVSLSSQQIEHFFLACLSGKTCCNLLNCENTSSIEMSNQWYTTPFFVNTHCIGNTYNGEIHGTHSVVPNAKLLRYPFL